MASAGPRPAAVVTIPLALPHTRCSRCNVWSRRPDRCPHCGAVKAAAAGSAADGGSGTRKSTMRQLPRRKVAAAGR